MVNDKLATLDLGYNEIKDQGAYALAQGLKNNGKQAISMLSVNNNYITKAREMRVRGGRELRARKNGAMGSADG